MSDNPSQGGLPASLQSDHPPLAVRIMLVAEVFFFVGVMTTYLCVLLPSNNTIRWFDPVFYVFALAFPIGMNILHGDWLPDSGIRLDNIKPSAIEVGLATAAMAAGLMIVGWAVDGWHWRDWDHLSSRIGRYAAWGPIQQYMLQAFGLRRFKQARLSDNMAVVAAAGVFGFLHAPNWPLVGITFGAGLVWCRLFLRHPNLLTIGLAHGILAILIYYVLPEAWLHRLAVGGMYWEAVAKYAQRVAGG
ncbi:MAG: type II CAAX prenyl endopeptidase Rce1 family protein [Phycisphaerae bacterium]